MGNSANTLIKIKSLYNILNGSQNLINEITLVLFIVFNFFLFFINTISTLGRASSI